MAQPETATQNGVPQNAAVAEEQAPSLPPIPEGAPSTLSPAAPSGSQAGTQVDISTKFHTIVSEEKMLEQGQRINIS